MVLKIELLLLVALQLGDLPGRSLMGLRVVADFDVIPHQIAGSNSGA